MGALHDGHLSLIRAARAQADEVVVSLFVNPSQFNDPDDLAKYPRDEERDAQLAQDAGADILFAPPPEIVYPPGFSTEVRVGGALTETLEGSHRGPEHFHGVATVVTKLFNMVQPDLAFFGQKDAQQALVIRKLVRDLDMDVQIEIAPTVREPDGLALSSRNVRLHGDDRRRALALSKALDAAERAAAGGERNARVIAQLAREQMQQLQVEPEYLELVNPEDLAPVHTVRDDTLVAVAARIGEVRLIDNTVIKGSGS
jgi:pantoate--beta-alanine ligase